MSNQNEEDTIPLKSAEEVITEATIEHSQTVDGEEEEENDNKLSSITTNNGATSSKGV